MIITVRFVKHNKACLKAGKEEENRRILFEFLDKLEGKIEGLKGYAVLENARDGQEMIVLTFWETKEDMDMFYQPGNKALAELLEKSKESLNKCQSEMTTE